MWTVEKLIDPLNSRGSSLHRSDDLCGACGSSALLLREFAWCISAGKAVVDRLACGVYCAESSFLLEDVGMILLSSLSMARRKVRNFSYLASTLVFIIGSSSQC